MPETTILLADAGQESSATLRSLLESWHYQVETLNSGTAPSDVSPAPSLPPSRYWTAISLAMSGLEIITEIRRSHQRSVWLMLMSGSPDAEQVGMATNARVDDFLLKPVNEFDLLVRLRKAERVQQLYRDLDEQMEAVRFHASHDSLTGLLNREAMLRQLFQETDRVQRMKTPLTMMLIDLDKLSRVNGTYGYATGDAS